MLLKLLVFDLFEYLLQLLFVSGELRRGMLLPLLLLDGAASIDPLHALLVVVDDLSNNVEDALFVSKLHIVDHVVLQLTLQRVHVDLTSHREVVRPFAVLSRLGCSFAPQTPRLSMNSLLATGPYA